MSDNDHSDDLSDKDDDVQVETKAVRRDVELHNPNLIEDDETDYEEVDDDDDKPVRDTDIDNKRDDNQDNDDDDDDDEDVAIPPVEGSYDPSDYDNLDVDNEVRDLFSYIMKYTPQTVELDHKFKPFIPDYIPAVGDIDAFIRCTRPDSKAEVSST